MQTDELCDPPSNEGLPYPHTDTGHNTTPSAHGAAGACHDFRDQSVFNGILYIQIVLTDLIYVS